VCSALRECSLRGSLPDEIGAWVDIEAFDVTKNALGGKLPLSMRRWTKLRKLLVDQNSFSGGPLPALPFATFARPWTTPDKFSHLSDCTISDEDHDTYACPWPAGAKDVCMIRSLDVPYDQQHFRLVNDSDCHGTPPPTPPPTPEPPAPTPAPLYHCVHDKCVPASSGVTLSTCQSVCGTLNFFKCVDDKCVPASSGVTQSACQSLCGKALRGAVAHAVTLE